MLLEIGIGLAECLQRQIMRRLHHVQISKGLATQQMVWTLICLHTKHFFLNPIIILYLYKQKKIESTRLTAQGRLPRKYITKAMSCVLSKDPTTRNSHRLKASKGCRSRSWAWNHRLLEQQASRKWQVGAIKISWAAKSVLDQFATAKIWRESQMMKKQFKFR